MNTKSKVAIYCRLSEEDRNKQHETDDSNSIQNQKSMLIQYVLEQGWEVYNIYSDDDYTGADRRRPQFKRLLKDAEQHKFDIILCKTQSRFTRELELVEKYIHGLFPIWGIRFVSIVDNADTDNKGNKKSRQINGLVNEWYLEDMSDNIRSVLTNRRVNGLHIGAFALYGYRKDPDRKGHLLIDEEAAAVVREVFNLFAQGYGENFDRPYFATTRGIPNPHRVQTTAWLTLQAGGEQKTAPCGNTLRLRICWKMKFTSAIWCRASMAVCRIKPSSASRVRKISGMLCAVRTSRLLTRNCGTRYVGGEQSAADRSVMEKLVFSHAKHGAHIAAIRFGPPRRRTGTICNVRIGISL